MTRLFLFVPRSQLHQKRKHSLWHVLRNLIERLQFLSIVVRVARRASAFDQGTLSDSQLDLGLKSLIRIRFLRPS